MPVIKVFMTSQALPATGLASYNQASLSINLVPNDWTSRLVEPEDQPGTGLFTRALPTGQRDDHPPPDLPLPTSSSGPSQTVPSPGAQRAPPQHHHANEASEPSPDSRLQPSPPSSSSHRCCSFAQAALTAQQAAAIPSGSVSLTDDQLREQLKVKQSKRLVPMMARRETVPLEGGAGAGKAAGAGGKKPPAGAPPKMMLLSAPRLVGGVAGKQVIAAMTAAHAKQQQQQQHHQQPAAPSLSVGEGNACNSLHPRVGAASVLPNGTMMLTMPKRASPVPLDKPLTQQASALQASDSEATRSPSLSPSVSPPPIPPVFSVSPEGPACTEGHASDGSAHAQDEITDGPRDEDLKPTTNNSGELFRAGPVDDGLPPANPLDDAALWGVPSSRWLPAPLQDERGLLTSNALGDEPFLAYARPCLCPPPSARYSGCGSAVSGASHPASASLQYENNAMASPWGSRLQSPAYGRAATPPLPFANPSRDDDFVDAFDAEETGVMEMAELASFLPLDLLGPIPSPSERQQQPQQCPTQTAPWSHLMIGAGDSHHPLTFDAGLFDGGHLGQVFGVSQAKATRAEEEDSVFPHSLGWNPSASGGVHRQMLAPTSAHSIGVGSAQGLEATAAGEGPRLVQGVFLLREGELQCLG